MRNLNFLILVLISSIVVSCGTSDDAPKKKQLAPTKDPHSYSNFEKISTKHLHLDLTVDFETKTVSGVARHRMNAHTCDTAIFDIKALDIEKVTLGKGNEIGTDFEVGDADDVLGRPLKVKIKPDARRIEVCSCIPH